MAQKPEERGVGPGIVAGGIGGTVLGVAIAMLIAAKPAAAAPPEEKLDYLIEVLTTLVPVLAELSERQATLTELLEQWLAAQGVPGLPTVEVTVRTPWVAKEPEQIFSKSILSAGTFYSDVMVDWTRGKRIVFKVESSLNQAVNIQLIGNTTGTKDLATDVGPVLPCSANGNISVGPAFDDWHPFIGVRITVAVAPTAGILTIWAVIQE
ncbi:hypothetical protein ES703_14607 [subsurface metagenome]